ncbi:MAG TPA: hypothetical protein VFW83_02610 [Bryobacteraceae bacterium]|nr:hypothetical protein [Bryobacteraceae bacterium]
MEPTEEEIFQAIKEALMLFVAIALLFFAGWVTGTWLAGHWSTSSLLRPALRVAPLPQT